MWILITTLLPHAHQVDFVFHPTVTLRMKPLQYLYRVSVESYCLGLFDNHKAGTLIGGISVRNVLVQASVDVLRLLMAVFKFKFASLIPDPCLANCCANAVRSSEPSDRLLGNGGLRPSG